MIGVVRLARATELYLYICKLPIVVEKSNTDINLLKMAVVLLINNFPVIDTHIKPRVIFKMYEIVTIHEFLET